MTRFKSIVDRVVNMNTNYKSPTITSFYFAILNTYNYYTDNFTENIGICNEMEKYYQESETGRLTIRIKDVIYIKANSLLRIGNYVEGIRYIHDNQELFTPESPNWYLLQEDLFKFLVFNKDYDSAQKLIRRIAPWRENTALLPQRRERWLLRIGFLSLVSEYTEHLKYVRHFFTQQVTLTKDTLGYKTQVQIMQILYYIKEGEMEQANQGLNTLNRNLYRIKTITNPKRLVIFVRGLLNAIASQNNPKELRRIFEQVQAKFISYPPINSHFSEMEIMPYEQLWQVTFQYIRGVKYVEASVKRKSKKK